MIRGLPYKTKQFFFSLIKLSIVICAVYYCFNELAKNPELDLKTLLKFLNDNEVFTVKNVMSVLSLSMINWLLEITKWKTLVASISTISFAESAKQSLASLTASLITPNRIGDYAAKVVYYQPKERSSILFLNLLNNAYQMLVTTVFGLVGLYFFTQDYDVAIPIVKILRLSGLIFVLGLITLLGIKKKGISIRGFSIQSVLDKAKSASKTLQIKVFALSVIRYLVFSFQFYFLLLLFGVDVDYFSAMMVISSIYFIASLIPTFVIFDVALKGSVAVYLFGIFGVNSLTIVCLISTMWILNFMLPSMIGAFFILKFSYKDAFPKKTRP